VRVQRPGPEVGEDHNYDDATPQTYTASAASGRRGRRGSQLPRRPSSLNGLLQRRAPQGRRGSQRPPLTPGLRRPHRRSIRPPKPARITTGGRRGGPGSARSSVRPARITTPSATT